MGIHSERLSPCCTYLEHDDARILFDCGLTSEGGSSIDDAASQEARREADEAYVKRLEE